MSRKYFYVVSPWILRENKVLHCSRFVGGDLKGSVLSELLCDFLSRFTTFYFNRRRVNL